MTAAIAGDTKCGRDQDVDLEHKEVDNQSKFQLKYANISSLIHNTNPHPLANSAEEELETEFLATRERELFADWMKIKLTQELAVDRKERAPSLRNTRKLPE